MFDALYRVLSFSTDPSVISTCTYINGMATYHGDDLVIMTCDDRYWGGFQTTNSNLVNIRYISPVGPPCLSLSFFWQFLGFSFFFWKKKRKKRLRTVFSRICCFFFSRWRNPTRSRWDWLWCPRTTLFCLVLV